MKHSTLLLLCATLLAACGGPPQPQPTAPAARPSVVAASATPEAAASPYAGIPQRRNADGRAVLGSADAPVTIEVFSDVFCTVCAFQVLEVEPQLIARYVATGQVQLVDRHLDQISPDSLRAAEAIECAGDQGRYWELRQALYDRQIDLLGAGSLEGGIQYIAQETGLDGGLFRACMADGRYRDAVQADAAAARAAGVLQRPTFVIGERRLVGVQRLEDFTGLLDGTP
jgi:protein-disulfide isomerase